VKQLSRLACLEIYAATEMKKKKCLQKSEVLMEIGSRDHSYIAHTLFSSISLG